jgi:hypothetical protein
MKLFISDAMFIETLHFRHVCKLNARTFIHGRLGKAQSSTVAQSSIGELATAFKTNARFIVYGLGGLLTQSAINYKPCISLFFVIR